ncbi:T9SS type A sorting domain-containing protein [Cryomorpha ignava]|uniref:T9SS type A sorting domain-containing protein n=1 Tax=Cryomorpha ignava TaxID=101383 RepID=A0A7K3WKX6_9FLAO|nr:T9SS type A sorting domain-containing protein [Cryomorpha ignava]NEN22144.1 T9SS type A sorting domain-containing protein [Cryomorpha ignava]
MKGLLTLLLSIPLLLNAQQTLNETMIHDGIAREYIIYIPEIYDGNSAVPLLFNFHGFSMTASQQMQFGGDMRPVADTAGFILVYPQGTSFAGGNHWNVGSWTAGSPADDIGFTEAMIDTLSANYNIDLSRVYSCGYSNGGYFSFELACQLSNRIAAIGAVAGSMSTETYTSCNPTHPTPVLSIHGTADNVVSYNGGSPINTKSLADVNAYWSNYNNTAETPVVIDLPNTNTSDGSTVVLSLYDNGDQCTSVAHYKVIGGGHFWPGIWGNMDINASAVIWNFVSKYDINGLIGCAATSVNEVSTKENQISIFPNPAKDFITIKRANGDYKEYFIYSMNGKLVLKGTIGSENVVIDLSKLPSASYLLKLGDKTIQVVLTD